MCGVDAVSIIIGVVIGAALGAVVMAIAKRGAGPDSSIREERNTLRSERDAERAGRETAERELATLTERESQLQARFEQQREAIEAMRAQLLETFEASSRKALQDNSERFLQQATERMKPLREQLEKQEAYVKELEKSRARAYGEMGETLNHVLESHRQLLAETGRLTTALRRPDQRGRWGEVQLRRVVELAGMTEHCDFTEQTTIRDGDSRQRPDLIVMLPGGGRIAIDSKVPLDAYLDAVEVEDSTAREARRIDHANAVEQRWKELAKKSYWKNLEGSPELVVMFIPVESALMAAMEHKPKMHADAMEENVLIATPTLLVGLLRSVAFGWRRESLARDAKKIADIGRELYKRLQKFSELHGKVGQRLEQAVNSYNESVGSFNSQLLTSGRRMQELGIAGEPIEEVSPITTAPRLPAATPAGENE